MVSIALFSFAARLAAVSDGAVKAFCGIWKLSRDGSASKRSHVLHDISAACLPKGVGCSVCQAGLII